MNPNEALQYLSTVASDYARTLPPSAQGPTVQAINAALSALAALIEQPPSAVHENAPRLAVVD